MGFYPLQTTINVINIFLNCLTCIVNKVPNIKFKQDGYYYYLTEQYVLTFRLGLDCVVRGDKGTTCFRIKTARVTYNNQGLKLQKLWNICLNMQLKKFKYTIKYVPQIIYVIKYAVLYIYFVKLVIGNRITNTNTGATITFKRIGTITITVCWQTK